MLLGELGRWEGGISAKSGLRNACHLPVEPVAERRLVLASEFIPRARKTQFKSREATAGTSIAGLTTKRVAVMKEVER